VHDAELPGCSALTAVGEIFCYAGIDDRLFARLHNALAPGGVLLFDIATPGREGSDPRRAWHEGDGWLLCMEARADGAELTRAITTFTQSGDDGSWRRMDETHTLQLYDPGEVVAALRAAGFASARVLDDGYGPELDLPPGLVVIEARR
jgi:hypothetical protein